MVNALTASNAEDMSLFPCHIYLFTARSAKRTSQAFCELCTEQGGGKKIVENLIQN